MRFPLAKPDKAHTNLPPPKISHFSSGGENIDEDYGDDTTWMTTI